MCPASSIFCPICKLHLDQSNSAGVELQKNQIVLLMIPGKLMTQMVETTHLLRPDPAWAQYAVMEHGTVKLQNNCSSSSDIRALRKHNTIQSEYSECLKETGLTLVLALDPTFAVTAKKQPILWLQASLWPRIFFIQVGQKRLP